MNIGEVIDSLTVNQVSCSMTFINDRSMLMQNLN
jgi:hypothetical protein